MTLDPELNHEEGPVPTTMVADSTDGTHGTGGTDDTDGTIGTDGTADINGIIGTGGTADIDGADGAPQVAQRPEIRQQPPLTATDIALWRPAALTGDMLHFRTPLL